MVHHRLVIARSVLSSLSLERSRRAASQARSFVRERCLEAGVAEGVCDSAVLMVSELVTNAVEHARSRVELAVAVSPRDVHVEVGDHNAALPAVRHPDTGAVHGRGMAIVDALASAWGVRPAGRGKTVWFDLPR
ncbi:anti-sigma regulatory factor (Ser/Thr protein kinase) [Kineococcus rhizosphaerae]|uniref:Anti-sigma regulatory factor (Ser/Thr protein kinase) n=1 Tax=Kineococcus rhizosphaerae TaxID=559628 RepID=A0A2T0R301_9ACTN|nr:anti-sigma regulatory factor (Ser/Thr protein kinase) [Kineococcus rhizosphaerae]